MNKQKNESNEKLFEQGLEEQDLQAITGGGGCCSTPATSPEKEKVRYAIKKLQESAQKPTSTEVRISERLGREIRIFDRPKTPYGT